MDRAFVFGDAVYEVIRIYHGQLWLAEEHLQRLENSLRELEINQNINRVKTSIFEVFTRSHVSSGFIYIQISRGSAPRTHYFPEQSVSPNCLIWCQSFDDSWLYPLWENGISVISHPDLRWARRDIKTVNLLGNCIAMEKAKKANCFEAILIDNDGTISEATSNNVFGVKNGFIITPPKSHKILPGITRGHILNLAKNLNINVVEKLFTFEDLINFDEGFITGSIMEIMPVVKVNQFLIAEGKIGAITKELRDSFFPKIIQINNNEPRLVGER
jgi:D-alanine transaminase